MVSVAEIQSAREFIDQSRAFDACEEISQLRMQLDPDRSPLANPLDEADLHPAVRNLALAAAIAGVINRTEVKDLFPIDFADAQTLKEAQSGFVNHLKYQAPFPRNQGQAFYPPREYFLSSYGTFYSGFLKWLNRSIRPDSELSHFDLPEFFGGERPNESHRGLKIKGISLSKVYFTP
ncbi:MAG: hypothetical protein AAB531_04070 [Patescibacteria group bacterium]